MHIIILGCDNLGTILAAELAREGHRMTVMDASPDRLDSLPQEPQVEAVLTTDSLMEDLRGVALSNVDVFLALTDDDNKNVMAAQVASHIFHVPEVICRIGDPQREAFYRGLGINVVCPTTAMVDSIKKGLNDAH